MLLTDGIGCKVLYLQTINSKRFNFNIFFLRKQPVLMNVYFSGISKKKRTKSIFTFTFALIVQESSSLQLLQINNIHTYMALAYDPYSIKNTVSYTTEFLWSEADVWGLTWIYRIDLLILALYLLN